ncbi:MAG: hypothetical protein AAF851_19790 [Myxococcota bacterium]
MAEATEARILESSLRLLRASPESQLVAHDLSVAAVDHRCKMCPAIFADRDVCVTSMAQRWSFGFATPRRPFTRGRGVEIRSCTNQPFSRRTLQTAFWFIFTPSRKRSQAQSLR